MAPAVRQELASDEAQRLRCYTFDELLDRDVDFSKYFEWLEAEVKERLTKILTADQRKKLESLRPPGGRGGPGGRPKGDGPDDKDRPGRPKGEPKERPKGDPEQAAAGGGVQWYATLAGGLKETERTGKPILFLTAAPHCAGVPGIW